jgi:hypothetical protein
MNPGGSILRADVGPIHLRADYQKLFFGLGCGWMRGFNGNGWGGAQSLAQSLPFPERAAVLLVVLAVSVALAVPDAGGPGARRHRSAGWHCGGGAPGIPGGGGGTLAVIPTLGCIPAPPGTIIATFEFPGMRTKGLEVPGARPQKAHALLFRTLRSAFRQQSPFITNANSANASRGSVP